MANRKQVQKKITHKGGAINSVERAIERMNAAGVSYKHMADLVNLRLAKVGSDKRICPRTIILVVKMEKPHKMNIDRREAILNVAKRYK